ncbi:MAG: sulfatase-like hydrolase/transferase [Draconibacterium sp.]|nr:sulfatase-like hydrolase/transferase [Draconibacterium sp.]
MKNNFRVLGLIVFVSVLTVSCQIKNQNQKAETKPNIIYILADDLGYGELGCYGQEKIETPNIDQLAKEGLMFTQHYSGSAVCAPSRSVLLTGKHSGHTDIRNNGAWASRGDVQNIFAMVKDSSLEGNLPLLDNTVTLANLLQNAGYKTGMSGKWGLGAPHVSSIPTKKGFDFFIGYICQRMAHTYYPPFLYKNDRRIYLDNETIDLGEKFPKDKDPLDEKNYARYTQPDYAPEVMYNEMENFVVDNKNNPFFFYWASIIPHVALAAPQNWIDYYVEKFGDEEPYNGNRGYYPHRYPHAAYAAMVSYFDENVGKLIAKLKELGIYDNTLIIFTSDNGPTFNGGADSKWFESTGVLGGGGGRIKGSVYEGGIRVPMIASWPGKIKPGTKTDHVSAFWDVMPTLCDIAKIDPPKDTDGISMLPTFLGDGVQEEHSDLYWELGVKQAVRMGKWKGIRKNSKEKLGEIELYNLENDIKEDNNVAEDFPEIVEQIKTIMQKEHVPAEIDAFKQKVLGDK